MRPILLTSTPRCVFLALVCAAFAAASARAGNVLTNPGFEEPQVRRPGNNFPPDVPGWTLTTTTPPCADGHNVVLADGSGYADGPDLAAEGVQYYEICGAAGYLEQTFELLEETSDICFGAYFSRRGADAGGGNVEIYDRRALVRASAPVSVPAGASQELWVVSRASIPRLGPGIFTVRINLDDTGNVDGAFVITGSHSGVVGDGTPASVTEAALDCALANATGPITFNSGGGAVVIPFTAAKTITRNTTILGGNRVTLSGQGAVTLFSVSAGAALTLQDIVLDRGLASTGGAIRNQGTLVLHNVRISNCIASAHGGAIQNSGSLTCTGARFEYNRAAINGGALDNTGTAVLTGCTATNNSAEFRGGAFYNYLGTLETTNCVLKWNTAGAYGGGMAADGGMAKSTGDRVRGNRAGGTGGGLSLNGDATVRDAECSLNTSASFGGGVDAGSGTVSLQGLRLYSNAGHLGGGLATRGGTTTVTSALIQYNRNTSTTNQINHGGGGVYVEAGALSLTDSRISNNRSNYAGGGVMVNAYQTATLRNCIVSGNEAYFGQLGSQVGTLDLSYCTVGPGQNSGIWSDGGTLTISATTVTGNRDAFYGGGISLRRGAAATIINSTISGNSSLDGGGIYLETGFGGSSADLTNVTIAGNTGNGAGGNLYIGTGTDVALTVKNTIIANPGGGGNCAGKEITSSRYSISSDNLCALTGPGDRNGTDPMLGPLQNNGGPTMTHLPLAGSPAIDGVLGTQAPALDQRGRLRPAGLGFDIGAVEVNAPGGVFLPPPPPSVFDGNDRGDDDGDGSRDVEELIAGTDPNSPADVFRLSILPGSPPQAGFQSKTGIHYRVYVSSGPPDNPLSSWTNAGLPTIAGNDALRTFPIVPAAGVARRFYIVRALPADGPWP